MMRQIDARWPGQFLIAIVHGLGSDLWSLQCLIKRPSLVGMALVTTPGSAGWGITKALSARAASVGRTLQLRQGVLALLPYNSLRINNLLLRSFGHRVAPTPQVIRSFIFHLPKCGAGENVEKVCAVSARDSLLRDFTPCARAAGGGNWNEHTHGSKTPAYLHFNGGSCLRAEPCLRSRSRAKLSRGRWLAQQRFSRRWPFPRRRWWPFPRWRRIPRRPFRRQEFWPGAVSGAKAKK